MGGVLEGLGVRYVLGGSLASVVFGEPRATLDVDIAADLTEQSVRPFLEAIAQDYFVDEARAIDEARSRGSFQLVHRASMIRVDMFVPAWTGLHLWKWRHRRRVAIGTDGSSLDVTGPEAIVVQKLVWFREGGEVSDRQWRDVLGVLKCQGDDFDLVAAREQAVACAVADLLDRAAIEAGVEEP
ncbi:MAG: hypothetical protein KDC98_17670 [Planctomycetes bacterium]|nr:hypothetical protein [Planctomycetota bacterium]